jgi:hypothetical protein
MQVVPKEAASLSDHITTSAPEAQGLTCLYMAETVQRHIKAHQTPHTSPRGVCLVLIILKEPKKQLHYPANQNVQLGSD